MSANPAGPDGDAVVVPAVASGSSATCVRSPGRRGVHTVAAAADPAPPSTGSRYCGERRPVPSPWDGLDGYAEGLLALARRLDVRTVVPLREPDIYVLSKHRGEFADHDATPWPDFETVRTVQDRRRLLGAADRADVATLADFYENGRCFRVIDGADEVHKRSIARSSLDDSELVPEELEYVTRFGER